MHKFILLSLLLASQAFARTLPNAQLTPGASRVVTQTEICTTGSAALARNVSQATKLTVYKAYFLAGNHTGYCKGREGCEVDHLIAVELGGSNDIANLWPQPYQGARNAHMKDRLEGTLHRMVCSNQITLQDAQKQISKNWIKAYQLYVSP